MHSCCPQGGLIVETREQAAWEPAESTLLCSPGSTPGVLTGKEQARWTRLLIISTDSAFLSRTQKGINGCLICWEASISADPNTKVKQMKTLKIYSLKHSSLEVFKTHYQLRDLLRDGSCEPKPDRDIIKVMMSKDPTLCLPSPHHWRLVYFSLFDLKEFNVLMRLQRNPGRC